MAKRQIAANPVGEAPGDDPQAPPLVELEYIGPAGQTSPAFGLLSVGARYQVNVPFAAYLVERHPDFWQRPAAPASS